MNKQTCCEIKQQIQLQTYFKQLSIQNLIYFWSSKQLPQVRCTFMLFQNSPPLFIKKIQSRRLIILTKYRIIYTNLDKTSENLHAILVQQNPLQLQYSVQRQESFVVTENSIQIYTCDYIHEVHLKKVLILNQERVFSIFKASIKDWQVFGQIYQYSSKNVKIHAIQQRALAEQALSSCFIEEFEIYVSKKRNICIYDHKRQIEEDLKWNQETKQVQKYLRQSNGRKVFIKAFKLYATRSPSKLMGSKIKQCKSQLYPDQKQQFLLQNFQGSPINKAIEFNSHSLINPFGENSKIVSSFKQSREFVILMQIDGRFTLVLIPPEKQYLYGGSKQIVSVSLQSSLRASRASRSSTKILSQNLVLPFSDIRTNLSSNLHGKDQNSWGDSQVSRKSFKITTKWQMKQLALEKILQKTNLSNFTGSKPNEIRLDSVQILLSNTYQHFSRSSNLKNHMLPVQMEEDKFMLEENDDYEGCWFIYRLKNAQQQFITKDKQVAIFSFIKLDHCEHQQSSSYDIPLDQNGAKSIHIQNYLLDLSSDQSNQNNSKEFFQMLLQYKSNRQKTSQEGISKEFVVELINIEKKRQTSVLWFLNYIQGNKSKQLTTTKIKAIKLNKTNSDTYIHISDPPSLAKETSGKGLFIATKNSQNSLTKTQNTKKSKENLPILTNVPKLGLADSKQLTGSQPVTSSQPITLTYSDETSGLEITQFLSRIPSAYSQKSQSTAQLPESLDLKFSERNEKSKQNEAEQSLNPLKQSRNKSQLSSNALKQTPEKESTFQKIEQVNQIKINPFLTPQHNNAITQLSAQNQLEDDQNLQQEQVQEVMEIIDIKEQAFAKNFTSQKSSQNEQKISSSTSLDKNLAFSKKSSINKQLTQKQQVLKNKVDQRSHKKFSALDHSLQNQSEEKQFYQKFINHFDHKEPESHEQNFSQTKFNINDSRESFDKNFAGSKASVQDYRKDHVANLIGGKDISQIMQNQLRVHTDQDEDCSEQTIQLGEEIQKEYSRNKSKMMNSKRGADQQNINFSKQNNSVSYSQPTVILLDKIQADRFQNSIDNQNSIIHEGESIEQPFQHNNPTTPAFNYEFHHFDNEHGVGLFKQPQIGIVSNDQWGNFTKKWNSNTNTPPIQEKPGRQNEITLKGSQLSLRESRAKLIDKKEFSKLSKKIQSFCVNPDKLTWEEARQIQGKKYTQLMRQTFIKSEEKFNTLMRQFLAQIIREEEARLFFAEYIRTFSGKTRDILIRLYMSLPENDQNKKYMSRALSEFKLSEVPQICFPISRQIIQIFKFLYPSVFVEDLLKPSIPLYQKLMENYFAVQKLPMDELTIEDEVIDLTHPRNMLNILLYLNQHFNLQMSQLFQVYCTELIKNDCSEIIVKMIKEEQTFSICEVKKDFLEDTIQSVIIEKLKECSTNIQWVGKTLQILDCNISPTSQRKKQELSIILNIIDMLNLSDCFFNIDTLFNLPSMKNLFVFCNTLIRQNNCKNLRKVNFCFLYKELYSVTYGQKLKYYNQELKDLLQILCEKYFQNGSVQKAFEVITPIVMITKRGFIAKMLFKYMDGKLMNRLSNKTFNSKQEFISTFKQCFVPIVEGQLKGSQQSTRFQHDMFEFDSTMSYLVKCPYFKFLNMYNNCIKSTQCEEVVYICYTDFQLASQLSSYHFLNKKQWQQLSQSLKDYVPKQQIKKLVAKNTFKFDSRVKINDEDDDQNHLIPSNSLIMKDSGLLNSQPKKPPNSNLIKSLQTIDIQKESEGKRELCTKKINVFRSKSDPKVPEGGEDKYVNGPAIESLKYQVNPQSIKSILKQIYEKQNDYSPMKKFIEALSIVDRQRIKICHYEKFKTIVNLELDFQIEKLLPFQFFLIPDYEKCFQLVKEKTLDKSLTIKNFWAIYIIMEILLSKGEDVAVLMIQNLLREKKGENLVSVVEKIIDGSKISQHKLKYLSQKAKKEGAKQVQSRISERILQKIV